MDLLNEKLPIYIKIVEGVKNAILKNELKEDEQLPSTTFLSKEYNINIGTVNKAMNVLVNEGYIYKKRGIGMFVSKDARKELILERKKVFKENFVKATLVEAKQLDIGVEELQEIVKEVFEEIK